MKNQDHKLTIKRTSTSSYFSAEFNQLEKESLDQYVELINSESKENEEADILITNTHTNFNLFTDQELRKLKLIIHPNSGYDNIPLDFVKRVNIPIVIGNSIRSHAVSQYILSAMFGHYSKIPATNIWDWDRKWPRKNLLDLKVTILGYGHIGKILEKILTPLVNELSIYDPYQGKTQLNQAQSDVIILACSLNSKNRHIIDKKFLNFLKEDVLIINTSRGELLAEADLINFLDANDKAFAYLDVFEKEPNNFSDFRHLKNVRLTSHIAGVYKNIDTKTIEFEVQTVKDFLELTDFDFRNKYQKMILQNKLRPEMGLI
jgi:D-3-phosphoglycerate dehydrogenase